MKREILFKAKHIHVLPENEWTEGKWVEGFLSGEDYINDGTYEWLARKCMSYKGILDHTDSYNIKRRYNANKTIQICKGVISHESKIRHYTRECYC